MGVFTFTFSLGKTIADTKLRNINTKRMSLISHSFSISNNKIWSSFVIYLHEI